MTDNSPNLLIQCPMCSNEDVHINEWRPTMVVTSRITGESIILRSLCSRPHITCLKCKWKGHLALESDL